MAECYADKTKKAKKLQPELLVHEYPVLGKYRVRVLHTQLTIIRQCTSLDIREYVSAEKFQGFTRRGIRLNTHDEICQLRDVLKDVLGQGWMMPRRRAVVKLALSYLLGNLYEAKEAFSSTDADSVTEEEIESILKDTE